MKTVRTQKGTELPLLNLKGKDYLQVAHRIQWFTEQEASFNITTEFLVLTDEQTVCKATIETYDANGRVVKKAQGTKRETKKDFSDHTEKAETGALGRALIELGYGTQFALSDLDEGMRLADSPVVDVRTTKAVATTASASAAPTVVAQPPSTAVEPLKKSSFRKSKATTTPAPVASAAPADNSAEDWV